MDSSEKRLASASMRMLLIGTSLRPLASIFSRSSRFHFSKSAIFVAASPFFRGSYVIER